MHSEIVLDELDRQGTQVELSHQQAEALAATTLVEVRPQVDGRWRLLPRGKVGVVRINDLQIRVTPKGKVGLTRLLFLLGYAVDPGFRPETVAGIEDADLWPALAESLARFSERATGGGVLQGYRTIEDATRTIRGRIRISDQIARRPGQMIPIEVTYDEFTIDIPENQILRSAIRRMLAVPRLSASARARLTHLDGRLAAVSLLRPGTPTPSWRQTRLNEHYGLALRLAEVVLANTSVEAGDGGVQVAAFVVDMPKVFEDFIGTALAESLLRYPGNTRMQYPTRLDEKQFREPSVISMYVDIVHMVSKQPRLIFDAKYKAAAANDRYPNADHYQMLAYCTALDLPTAWLVYADAGQAKRRLIRNTDIEIIEYPIDISLDPKDLLDAIDRLANRAWNRALMQQRSKAA